MASIILPPIPPRPAPAVRPTMVRELKEPDNKGTEVVMVKGPGTEPGPQPEPPKPLAVAEGKGANWVGTNVYEIGQTVEGRTAEYEGGVEPVTYRYRFQTKAAGSDSWVNQSWTNTTKAKNPVFFEITEAGQLKLQSQARDSSDPTVQLNSVTGIKTIQPQTTIGELTVAPSDRALSAGAEQKFTSAFTGDASDVRYSWSIRSGNAQLVSPNTTSSTVTYSFFSAGPVQVQCTCFSDNSSDSPQSFVSMAIVS